MDDPGLGEAGVLAFGDMGSVLRAGSTVREVRGGEVVASYVRPMNA